MNTKPSLPTRRDVLKTGGAAALLSTMPAALAAQNLTDQKGDTVMSTIEVRDGTNIFFKDWGPRDAQPIVFHHGWPLSGDDWDNQMLFFLAAGYRVIAHDRRGHGRSDQTDLGHDMATYSNDVVDLAAALDLKNAIHIGHSTGGGEVAAYVAKAEQGRVAKAALLGAIPPLMLATDTNPDGVPSEVFDGLRAGLATNRAQFFINVPTGPFYGFNREGAEVSQGLIDNWWRQGMMGSASAHYRCIAVFSETDQTEDLKAMSVPTLVMHGDDDQVVPIGNSAEKAIKLLPNGELKVYPGLSHGFFATHPDLVNADLLDFVKS